VRALDAKRRPRSVVDAQFSLPFSVATALVRGAAWPDDFAPARFDDPAIRHVMDRVEPARDPALDARFPRTWPCWVRITLDDGTRLEHAVTHPLGDPENFPSDDALAAKFARLAACALGRPRTCALRHGEPRRRAPRRPHDPRPRAKRRIVAVRRRCAAFRRHGVTGARI
jgi:2-methylcitrate dehydratase PrpD